MDTVEIVLTIEKEFEIEIPDEVAAKLVTVGMVADYVALALEAKVSGFNEPVDSNQITKRIVQITGDILDINPDLIGRDSSFVEDLRAD